MKKRLAIFGSTGSIGTQALEVVQAHPDLFETEVLTANENADLLIKQAKQFRPNVVVIANEQKYNYVSDALAGNDIKVYSGTESLSQVAAMETIDLALVALVGYSGLLPTISSVKAGIPVALANKETLVIAGDIITKLVKEHNSCIIPVDSEHSAIFQCLIGEQLADLEKIYLTASGGPFRNYTPEQIEKVTPRDALSHPIWKMGPKVTVDSASMMNKGLEAIEAKWLFNLRPEQIEVIIHPQSIIHSVVQFTDGSMKAQMGIPDMKTPISYALGFPQRLSSECERFSFLNYPALTFEPADTKKFRNLALAFEAMRQGGNMPCIMNAANEIAVEAFLQKGLLFTEISGIIEEVMNKIAYIKCPALNDYMETDKLAREASLQLIRRSGKI